MTMDYFISSIRTLHKVNHLFFGKREAIQTVSDVTRYTDDAVVVPSIMEDHITAVLFRANGTVGGWLEFRNPTPKTPIGFCVDES